MRHFHILVFIVSVFLSCKSIDPDSQIVDPLDIQAVLLDGTWKLKDLSSAVKDGNVEESFSGLEFIIYGSTKIGGNYSTVNSTDKDVWPQSGTWKFYNDDPNKIIRNDSVLINISVSDTTLSSSFIIIGGLKEGNWEFSFVK
tara:strand:- start:838 stop:1263 length:426 start_codon:yes stop_codon:yes gene_type:complete